eukprot:2244535-Prymnesium_polylepis.1
MPAAEQAAASHHRDRARLLCRDRARLLCGAVHRCRGHGQLRHHRRSGRGADSCAGGGAQGGGAEAAAERVAGR